MNIIEKIKNKFLKESFSYGLDIGTSSIKLVKIANLKDTKEVEAFKIIPIQDNKESQALKEINHAFNLKSANISVSGHSTIIRYIVFPKMTAEELSQSMKFEVQKHIPFSVSEINSDSTILKDDLPDNKMLVMLCAVKKDFISQKLNLLKNLNITPNLVDLDSIALMRSFNYSEGSENKTIALLNIGASFCNLNIVDSGLPCLSRDIHIAGNNITQKIADIFGIDFSAAEDLKLSPGDDEGKRNKILAATESVLSSLASELRTSFDYYESQYSSTVEKIFISGGTALAPSLKTALTNLLGIDSQTWDPFKKLEKSKSINQEDLNLKSPQLAVAAGLALRVP